MISVGAGRHTEPVCEAALSSDYYGIIKALLANMERMPALLHLPSELFHYAQRLEKLAQAAARDVAGGPEVPSELHDKVILNYEERRRVNNTWVPQAGVDFEPSLPIPNFGQELSQLIDVPWAGVARVGVMAILHAALLGAWTAFESFATDLWIQAVNCRPKSLAMDVVTLFPSPQRDKKDKQTETDGEQTKAQGPTIRFSDLAGFGFDVSKDMGNLLKQRKRVNLDSLTGLRNAYYDAFRVAGTKKNPDTVPGLVDLFDQAFAELRTLEAIRNLLAHRGGIVDPKFADEVREYSPILAHLKQQQPFPVDGRLVGICLGRVAHSTVALLNFVADWLKDNP